MRRKNNYTEFGIWAKHRLALLNMTQLDLAECTGIKRSVISDVLIGRNRKTENIEKIREILQEEA